MTYRETKDTVGKYIPIIGIIVGITLFFLKDKDLKKENRKKFIKKVGVFLKEICLRLLILLIIVLITYRVTKYVKADAANTVSIVVTVVGIVISCVDIVKNVFNDVFNNREE